MFYTFKKYCFKKIMENFLHFFTNLEFFMLRFVIYAMLNCMEIFLLYNQLFEYSTEYYNILIDYRKKTHLYVVIKDRVIALLI